MWQVHIEKNLFLTCCWSIKLTERRARWITRTFNIEKCPTKIKEGSLKKKNFAKLQNAARRWQMISGNYVLTTLACFLLEVNDRNQMKEMVRFIIRVLAYKLPMMKKINSSLQIFLSFILLLMFKYENHVINM